MAYDIIIGRDSSDKESFGERGLIYLGKGYVKMGNYTSLSNKLWMDVARSHVVLIGGKRGSGKCLHGDTLITLEDGSQLPIKDLQGCNKKVLSLNENLKIEKSESTDFFSRQVNKLLKIKLRSGKELKLTPEHPLLTIKGWQETQNLSLGSRIAAPRIVNSFGNEILPEHELKLLAYLIAEGHTKKIVLFSNSDEKIINEFIECLNMFDSQLSLIKEKENHYRISCTSWNNKVLSSNNIRDKGGRFTKESRNYCEKRSIRKLIEREGLFGLKSTKKYFSQKIMQLKKEQMALFLNRLFSCDGSIYKKKTQSSYFWEISYSSSSEKMIRQIQSILLRFGILSKLRRKKINLNGKNFESFELILNSEACQRFIEEIGFFGKKEERQIEAKEEIALIKKNPNVDTIPREVWEMYKPRNWSAIGRALNYKYPKAMRERIHYSPSRQTVLQIAEIEQSNPLLLLANSDIFWDEIISMEMLEGDFTVYDLCIPKNHNFVANDIVVHNSYSIGVIAEELANLPQESAKNIAALIFDTMGIFWTMKYSNEKEKDLIKSWELETKPLNVKVCVPFGKVEDYKSKGIPVDATFALKASELEAEDWLSIFNLKITSLEGVLLERTINELKEDLESFSIKDIKEKIEKDSSAKQETKEIIFSLMGAAETWGIFSKTREGTEIPDLINAGSTTILDVSVYSSIGTFNIRALVIGLVTRKIFKSRMDSRKKEEIEALRLGQDYLSLKGAHEEPLVWLFVDEAHEFLPKEGETPATDALIQILREGRQPGVSIVLATQQPGQIHRDVMSQSDIIIAHKVTSKADLEALNEIMQTYMFESIRQQMDSLPPLKGSALILDDNSERIYPMRMRPRFTWHGGEAPTAIKSEVKL